ncbi:histidine phosphatase family protein [Microbacterium ureisolvens]|uniref:Histidine phosphatase family protein n=1 Tax=Microbacterium ureisolvens TaxID=2781186 RepID=A0ABS7I3U7_9MICO|nr:histidine phosphatase family protein [Microbacterium ureisolvens]MBW9111224.1 histidine phosphatase family protein [Microbacterium ureisolvens]
MTGRIFVARHGETLLNALGRVQGWSDAPLTARGRAEAESLGRTLIAAGARIRVARCADLGRHRETAAAALAVAAPEVVAEVDERWREFAFGAYEGARGERLWADLTQAHGRAVAALRSAEVEVLDVLAALPALGAHAGVPVESVAEVRTRARAGFEAAVAAPQAAGAVSGAACDVLIVTSGLTLLVLLSALAIDTSTFEGGIGNGAVVTLVRAAADAGDAGRWTLAPAGAEWGAESVDSV